MRDLPKAVEPNQAVEVQLSPLGDYDQYDDEGNVITQHLTAETIQGMIDAFRDKVLVDADHSSEYGTSTEAMAWVTDIRFDDDLGFVGTMEFTDKGADAVSAGRYRFLSPAWAVDENGNPLELVSVGLTNKPNLPVRPILNRKRTQNNQAPTEGKKDNKMDAIIEALGLEVGATEEQVLEAINALKAEITANAEAKAKEEAQAFANENADLFEDKEELKNSYKANLDLVNGFVANMRKAQPKDEPKAKVVNTARASAPAPVANMAKISKMSPKDAVAALLKGDY